MSEKKDWLPRVQHKDFSKFVAMAGDQLSHKDFNDIVAGRKVLKALGRSVAGSTKKESLHMVDNDPPIAISYARMLEIAGERSGQIIITPETISDLFGIKESEIPPIIIREWELARYIDSAFPHAFLYWPASDMSMKDVSEKLIPKYKENNWGKVLFDTDWYGGGKESFFTNPIPAGWMAFSLAPILNTGGKNFLQQTEILKDFICKQIYRRKLLPVAVKEAAQEFNKKKVDKIRLLIEGDKWQEGAKMLANLKINQMFCPSSPAEELLFSAVVRAQTGKNIFENVWGWTTSLSRIGRLVAFGDSARDGAHIGDTHPRRSNDILQRFSFRRFPAAPKAA